MATDKRKPPLPVPADLPRPRGLALPRGLTRGFRALEERNYRLYWWGQLVALTGSWMQMTAQAWLVVELTESTFALGTVATLQFLPMMLLSLFGGVLADRLPKYRVLMVARVAALIQAGIFAALLTTGALQLWHIYVLAALLGTINAIEMPTRQAFVVELVGRDILPNAVALNSMQFNLARIIGPALAGYLIARLGFSLVFALNAISIIPVIAGLLMMRTGEFHSLPTSSRGPILTRLAEGVSYAWRTPQVLLVLLVVATIGTFGYNFSVVLPLIAGFVLQIDSVGFGLLSSALGVGSLTAAVALAYIGKATMKRLLIGAGCFCVLFAGVALSPSMLLSAALLAALGFAGITFTTSANTLLQLIVPDELRGRVMSLFVLLFAGSTPIGAFLIGSVSSLIGVPLTLLLCAGLCASGVIGSAAYYVRLERQAPPRPAEQKARA